MEAAIEGKHTLLLDMPYSRLRVRNFKHVRALKKDGGLVIAPHPFFPAPKCLNGKLRENLDLFDAIEFSHFYTRTFDFNRKAVEYARQAWTSRWWGRPTATASGSSAPPTR